MAAHRKKYYRIFRPRVFFDDECRVLARTARGARKFYQLRCARHQRQRARWARLCCDSLDATRRAARFALAVLRAGRTAAQPGPKSLPLPNERNTQRFGSASVRVLRVLWCMCLRRLRLRLAVPLPFLRRHGGAAAGVSLTATANRPRSAGCAGCAGWPRAEPVERGPGLQLCGQSLSQCAARTAARTAPPQEGWEKCMGAEAYSRYQKNRRANGENTESGTLTSLACPSRLADYTSTPPALVAAGCRNGRRPQTRCCIQNREVLLSYRNKP